MILSREQNKQCNIKGRVFNIQKFSVNDGPGIRTIVFLKGCPLRCKWCSNPESQNKKFQLMYNNQNCIECYKCVQTCGKYAIEKNNSGKKLKINRNICDDCGKCVEKCYSEALVMSGKNMTVEEVIKEVKKDSAQFRRSKGGLTISGGEPLMQEEFTKQLLIEAKRNGINTAIETTGYGNEKFIEEITPLIDVILLDIKNLNSEKHKEFTGVDNKIILENTKRISELAKELIIRVPVIQGFNADKKSIREIAKFVGSLETIDEIHLLPYHKMGVNKYECLGRDYELLDLEKPSEKLMDDLREEVLKEGLMCNIGAV
ncbi:glycyl-radical enzyme activating protein [uncultured Clostridium sp.]|uniref:glycyl-radical enzyme activating protein n=1 Tax=uncultured Clostridium sp. TaxID=59620 RepID=UPI0025838151|nr:glycyl-radical enzyme activating protein [uncultured Clostridium sp.]